MYLITELNSKNLDRPTMCTLFLLNYQSASVFRLIYSSCRTGCFSKWCSITRSYFAAGKTLDTLGWAGLGWAVWLSGSSAVWRSGGLAVCVVDVDGIVP